MDDKDIKIQFVYLTDPIKGSAISSHKEAKSHAARRGHARVRRQRMSDYQQERKKHEGNNQAPPTSASGSSASVNRAALADPLSFSSHANESSREMVLQLPPASRSPILEVSPLASLPKNVYSVFGTQTDPTQQFLIHHCE